MDTNLPMPVTPVGKEECSLLYFVCGCGQNSQSHILLGTHIQFPMYSITFGMYNIHVSVAEDSLRQRVTICQLQDVADSDAVTRWKPVCRRLGVRRDIFVEAEKAGSNDPSEAFVTALESWHDEQGDKATVSVLVEALEKSGFNEVAKTLK